MITLGQKTSANVNGKQIIYPHSNAGVNPILMVTVTFTTDLSQSLTSVTHNGRDLTRKAGAQIRSKVCTEIWYLVAPDTEGDIQIDFDADVKCICIAQTVRGVDQVEPFYFDTTVAANAVDSLPIQFQMVNGAMIFASGVAAGDMEANVESWQTEMWNIFFSDIRTQGIASFPNVSGQATVTNTLNARGDLSMAILGISAA